MNFLMSMRSVIHTVQKTLTQPPSTHSSRLLIMSARRNSLKDIYTPHFSPNSNLGIGLNSNLTNLEIVEIPILTIILKL